MSKPDDDRSCRRIAYLALGAFSGINQSVFDALKRRLPDYEIEWLQPTKPVWSRKIEKLTKVAWAALEFGPETGFDVMDWRQRCSWTTRVFERRSRVARDVVAKGKYRLALQTQSLYDGSTPGLPHFVYTDNTMMANRHYSDTSAILGRPMRQRGELPVTLRWISRERCLYQKSLATFAMSNNVRQSLIEDYGCREDQAVVAFAGCNATVASGLQNHYERGNIVFVGVDWERKGGPLLLEAFRRVRAQVPHATLTIVGCSPPVSEPGVHVVGNVPFSEVWRYHTEATVFCMPTRYEPFGIAYLEAMMHRLPVVATRVAAIQEFVLDGDSGFLVEVDDVNELANRLIQLLQNPELCRRMGERGRSIAQLYTWDRAADIMVTTINRHVPL